MYIGYYDSPLGVFRLDADAVAVLAIHFVATQGIAMMNAVVESCIGELDEYFNGKRQCFTVPVAPQGTDFQKQVWQALGGIPFGETASYEEIARVLRHPTAMRAVGAANRANPLPILVPCHRVIRKDGTLCGYASGVWRKEWLLHHEHTLTE